MNSNYLSLAVALTVKYAFSNRVINMWNNLPSDFIACSMVYSFKYKIDAFLDSQGFI
jgi:ribosome-associated toxin RatA of RatAB toxin-antitoxin module